jgi:hypothetical protein
MAKRGRKFVFHGAYDSKAASKRKEKRVHGFIVERKIKGHRREIVLTRRKGK